MITPASVKWVVMAAVSTACLGATEAVVLPFEELALMMSSVTAPIGVALRRGRGRPRKFDTPSRAITLTLPVSVIEKLEDVHPDLSKAVVRLAASRDGKRQPGANSPAALATFGRRAVITIRPTPSLERRAGVDLVPLPDGRALISFDQPQTMADLELMLYDAIEDASLPDDERKVFAAIGAILRDARRSNDVTLLRRSIIVLESKARAHPASQKPRTISNARSRSPRSRVRRDKP